MTLPRMDSRIGLDYIVENREYVSKLGTALDTNNTTVKKQVFELLSALCAYNSEGYSRAIETLEHYKNLKNERYRFKIVVNELEKTTTVEYQVALLAFINCVIISAPSLQDRLRIRNEFIGLKAIPILNNLRRVAHSVADIVVQLDVFDEQRECDEALSLQGPSGINLNSHLDVFYAILRQVADTPQEIPFLSILQHLLRIDPKEPISDIIWDTTEKLVHRATLLENHEDSVRLLRSPSVQKFSCPHCRGDATSPSRKQSVIPGGVTIQSPQPQHNQQQPNFTASIPTPPQPPPPPPPAAPPPPPPPMMMNNKNNNGSNNNMNRIPGAPPAPPPPGQNSLLSTNSLENYARSKTPEPAINESIKLLPQQETPAPKTKMKTINWNKIPPSKVLGKKNIWAIVADSHQDSPKADLDWNEMEGLFCLQTTSNQGSPKLGRDNGGGSDTLDRKAKKENSEISLLDGKRSLNVNIFLKQFRSSNEDIIQLIRDGEHYDIGAEKLRGLLKILPEVDELDMLRSFDGDRSRLGNAEKFLLQLLEVPNYKLRIECMLLKEEFAANVSYLEPCINAMLFAGDDLMTNKMLQEVLYMVVVAGNFLNSGGYAGNAAGVKLSSLQKLTDIRANKPGMNLIHFVALQAEKRNPNLLTFPTQLTALENASKTTSEQINNEINQLDSRIRKIKKQIDLPTTEDDIKNQMIEFLQAAEREVSILQRGMKEIELLRIKLSEFFCEDPGTFKLEECYKIFQIFCEKFNQAVKENERRRIQEEQANIRRKQREEQLARRAKQMSQCGTPVSDPENSLLLDSSAFDIRNSPAMSRRRVGSFNCSGELVMKEDGMSPDVTPNGSLRRRRSRVLADEDDNDLMEFLRSSGHDNSTRERKTSSYGSLDRSWARRARTGSGSKKRPDLLSIDFGTDRERPSSPSPLPSEVKPNATSIEEVKPRISREWRQKIESWLQANENDEKYNEEYKRRRRLTNNRRSLENDAESDRNKLDPLPEEKTTTNANETTTETYKRVYPDWKPSATLEKTDVVGAIEAIEDAHSKDKSTWKKSNIPNNSEISDDLRRIKRQRSNENQLDSIVEEDRRRSVIQQLGNRAPSDRLQIYIRRPSEPDDQITSPKQNQQFYIKPTYQNSPKDKNTIKSQFGFNNINKSPTSPTTIDIRDKNSYSTVEIDSDNIETPPVARRILSSPISKKSQQQQQHQQHGISMTNINASGLNEINRHSRDLDHSTDLDTLGQFDRFSAARRTRRYKRPTDHSSGNEDTSPTSIETISKDSNSVIINQTKEANDKPKAIAKSIDIFKVDNKEERLKRWQERLKNLNMSKDEQNTITNRKSSTSDRTVAKLEKVGRHISSINQEDVQEAIRNLKSPTNTPERIWSPPRDIIKEKPTIIKVSNHELNDEGFEETQSLVSDTPSHGKDSTSSCNEATEARTITKRSKPIRMTSTDSAGTTTSSDAPTKPKQPQRSQIQNLLERNRRSLERSRSMRTPTPTIHTSNTSSSSSPQMMLPRRTNSLRKSDSGTSTTSQHKQRDVERSSSRTSLRSSRSSLNSAVSTSTVRRIPAKTHITSSSTESSPSKRPLATQNSSSTINNNNINKSTNRIPASRSSSSGSSIGPGVRRPPLKSTSSSLGSTSFKENQQQSSNKTAARNSILSNRLITNTHNSSLSSSTGLGHHIGTSSSNQNISVNNTTGMTTSSAKSSNKYGISSASSRLSGFMRPTASSVTKRQGSDGKGKQ